MPNVRSSVIICFKPIMLRCLRRISDVCLQFARKLVFSDSPPCPFISSLVGRCLVRIVPTSLHVYWLLWTYSEGDGLQPTFRDREGADYLLMADQHNYHHRLLCIQLIDNTWYIRICSLRFIVCPTVLAPVRRLEKNQSPWIPASPMRSTTCASDSLTTTTTTTTTLTTTTIQRGAGPGSGASYWKQKKIAEANHVDVDHTFNVPSREHRPGTPTE